MLDEAFARLRTHRSNIQRYRQLLDTDLTGLERRFITRRMAEEQSAIETLSATTNHGAPPAFLEPPML
jgi:hypothetical protein